MTDLVTPTTDVASSPDAADLAESNANLAAMVAERLAAALDISVDTGPSDQQQSPGELAPPGGSVGLIASVSCPGVQQIVVVFDDDVSARLREIGDRVEVQGIPAAEISAGASDWLATIAQALEDWVRARAGTIESAIPLDSTAQLTEFVPGAPTTVLVGAGLFVADAHVATVALVGSSEPASAAGGADRGPTRMSPPAAGPERTADRGVASSLHMLADVEMAVTAELGRARMNVSQLLTLSTGSVIELDRTAGSPIDLLVNGTLIARGEVVVVDEDYGVRITEICGSDER